MTQVRAMLLDIYETTLSCDDFRVHATELPKLAGVNAELWNQQWTKVWATSGEALTDGEASIAEAYAAVLEGSGVPAAPALVAELVEADTRLLVSSCRVFEDTVRLLERMRNREIATAMVSNCLASTRAMLASKGLLDSIDVVVLSCEVHVAKPSPLIYHHALNELGVSAQDAVFVDDQEAYCEGAEAVGIRAVRIARDGPRPGNKAAISSLDELDTLL